MNVADQYIREEPSASSEALLRAIVDAAQIPIASIDLAGRLTSWNRAAERMSGWDAEEVLGGIPPIVLEDQYEEYRSIVRETVSGRSLIDFEIRRQRRDGALLDVSLSTAPVSDATGTVTGMMFTYMDITERKRSAEAVRKSQEQFQSAFQNAAIGMALVGKDGRFLSVNEAVCRIVGYPEQELLALTFQGLTHPDDRESDLAFVRRLLAGEIESYQLEKRYFHKHGHTVWILLTCSLVHDANGNPLHFIAQIQDITSRKQSEQALAASEARLRSVLETASDAIVTMAEDGRILSFNRGAEHAFGYTAAEAIGQPVALLVPDRLRERHVAGLRRYLATGEARIVGRTIELVGRRRDGVEFPLELSLAAVREGEETLFTGIMRDITERQHARVALERSVRELEAKTREQEAFIYTVSHDLRAPLVSLQGLANILAEDYGPVLDADARRYLDRIDANARKLQGLLSELLDLARIERGEAERAPVSLDAVVTGVVGQLRHTFDARGAEVRIDGPLPTVWGNVTRLDQLFTNLLDNAIHYTPRERAPLIRIGAIEHAEHWEIAVADNGVGIPTASRDKVFGLFQRLPAGKALNPGGTGAGLAIVARVVEKQDGQLWLESGEGTGTTFHFTLPKLPAGEFSSDITVARDAVANQAIQRNRYQQKEYV
ncbi:MAG: PAS domain S-box protein [Chloroflexota bacterium]